MVKIRLQRVGSKNNAQYRVIAADSRSRRDGRFIEILGQYQPVAKSQQVVLKEERIIEWLGKGAQPTDTVRDLLKKSGVWTKFKQPEKVAAETATPAPAETVATEEAKAEA